MIEMAETVNTDKLADAIVAAVRGYTEDVVAGIEQETDSTAKAILEDIIRDSPKKTGKYKKSWRITSQKTRYRYRNIIHNLVYRLVHLLEFGHVTASGRVEGKPHVQPAYDRHIGGYIARIKEIIRNGGRRA